MTTLVEDPYVTCPFDESHRIRKSRMQFHLVRCMDNYPLFETWGKRRCPYNAIHIIDASELMHHTRNCPDGTAIMVQELSLANKCFSGTISSEEANRQLEGCLPVNNDWDEDDASGPGYDPELKAHEKLIARVKIRASKAKKKQFRLDEQRRIAQLEAETGRRMYENVDTVSTNNNTKVRKPKTKAFQINLQTSDRNEKTDAKPLTKCTVLPSKTVNPHSSGVSTINSDQSTEESFNFRKLSISDSQKSIEKSDKPTFFGYTGKK